MLIKQLEDLPRIPSLRWHCLLALRAPPNCCFDVGCVKGIRKGQRKTTELLFQLSGHVSWVGTMVFEFHGGSK